MFINKSTTMIIFLTGVMSCINGSETHKNALMKQPVIYRKTALQKIINDCDLFPRDLCNIMVNYVSNNKLRQCAYLNDCNNWFCVEKGEKHLKKNQFYTIGRTIQGDLAICEMVVRKKSTRQKPCKGYSLYEDDGSSDNAYQLIAQQCNVPRDSIIVYTQDLPLDFCAETSSVLEIAIQIVFASSARSVSTESPLYKRALKKSTLFFEEDYCFADLCKGLAQLFATCKVSNSQRLDIVHANIFMKNYQNIRSTYESVAGIPITTGHDVLLHRPMIDGGQKQVGKDLIADHLLWDISAKERTEYVD
jgi:hypothetical protein